MPDMGTREKPIRAAESRGFFHEALRLDVLLGSQAGHKSSRPTSVFSFHVLPHQVQVECFSGDRFGGHAGEWLPQRLLRLRRVPAADHPKVSCFCHVVAFLSLTCGVHNCGLCFAHHGVHDTRMGQSWF